MKTWKEILCVVLGMMFLASGTACTSCNNIVGKKETSNDIIILTEAAVGTPVNADDPYKKYIFDHYGLNAKLIATTDFATTSLLQFSDSDNPPDIVAFSDVDAFRKISNQGVLLDDWTPYLDQMPNFKSIVEMEDAGRAGEPSIARLMLTEENKLTALWTLPDPPVWSLKIREDWANEYRATTTDYLLDGKVYYPAGNRASVHANGEKIAWQPNTPNDLINFARWIKITKNPDQKNLKNFGFSTAGEQTNFGVLGTWIPLMYGAVCQLPWGVYFTDEGEVDFGVTDGVHKMMLDYINTLVNEKLIEENWYFNKPTDKTSTSGHVGIEWYTGVLSESTQSYFNRNEIKDPVTNEIVDTTKWWETYGVPKEPTCSKGGFQASDGFLGQIITVSVKAANDEQKMAKICKFLDDLAMTKKTDANGVMTYQRSATYDALRWGVGIEKDMKFKNLEGTKQVYLYTGDEGKPEKDYRTQFPGAWDWGMFFRSTDDGVVQGIVSPNVTPIINKVIEHDAKTANYKRRLQYGSVLKLESTTVASLTRNMQSFEISYVTTKWSSAAASQAAYESFKTNWLSQGGREVYAQAKVQFKLLGFIK